MVLDYKPTWLVAAVCTIIVAISFGFERLLHHTGRYLTRNNQKPLFDALQKMKEELMVLGLISLLLEVVIPEKITNICVPKAVMQDLLPCDITEEGGSKKHSAHTCAHDKVQLFSHEDLKNLHEFIFCLAIAHVILSVLTVVSGEARIRQWRRWEDSLANEISAVSEEGPRKRFIIVRELDFIKRRYTGIEKYSTFVGWLQCFLRQFYRPITKSDYEALRQGFITAHCRGNPKFNFHKYMLRALEVDFETVVGISWYLWIIVVIFLLLNIYGWQTYVWIAFIPFILLLAVGTKLEHVITQLAHEVAERHTVVEGEMVVKPSDDHFWFHRPQVILFLIHFTLFQNAFEITYLFWYLIQFRFDKCKIVDPVRFGVRLIIGVIIRLLCSYSTLPLYALVTQMGTQIKKPVFDENVQDEIVGDGSTVDTSLEELQRVDIVRSNIDGGNTPPEIVEID